MKYTIIYPTEIGTLRLLSDEESLLALWFDDGKAPFDWKEAKQEVNYVLKCTIQWLDVYFSGQNPDFLPPLYLQGTAFQKQVLQALLEIPYGQTWTYGDISRKIFGSTKGSHAIGQAVGKNPISLIVPCHRVIEKKGLTGYAGGVYRKKWLLEKEKN